MGTIFKILSCTKTHFNKRKLNYALQRKRYAERIHRSFITRHNRRSGEILRWILEVSKKVLDCDSRMDVHKKKKYRHKFTC